MNPLVWFNPGRWLLYLALAGSLWLGYQAWAQHQQGIGHDRAVAEYQAQATKVDAQRAAVAPPIEAQHAHAVVQIRTVTKTIIKEVPTYVQADSCPLPGGWRLLHDAAAHGAVPDPAAIPDAAAVPAQDAATTVAENYSACRETGQRLTDLQQWIREQQALN